MKFGIHSIVVAAALASVFAFGGVPVAAQSGHSKLIRSEMNVPFRYILVFEPSAYPEFETASRSGMLASEMSRTYGGKVKKVFSHALKGYAAQMTA